MNMKGLASYCVAVLVTGSALAQALATLPTSRFRPPWSATVTVIDELGQPLSRADVEVSYYVSPPAGQTEGGERIHGPTDTSGVFHGSHSDTGSVTLGFRISKAGYYTSSLGRTLYEPEQFDEEKVNASRNIVFTVTLRKVGQPIPMYVKHIYKGPPVFNKPVGYDLMAGDWVAPHGKGVSTDIIFMKTSSLKSSTDYESKLTVSFPNQGDGIQEFGMAFRVDDGSALRSPREAPEAGYQPTLTRETSAHPGQPSKFDFDGKRNYFFRVRTVLDERGNVKSALYGKIYGDFMQFTYYLNSTPNDHNVEFDPTRNLLAGQSVPAP
jgi:hypothetical protein